MKKTKNKTLDKLKQKTKKTIGTKNFETLEKIILFGLGGVILLATKLALTYLLVDKIKINLTISYIITLIIAIIIGYLYSFYITFKNKTQFYKKLLKYTASIGLFYVADYALVILTTNILKIHYTIAIIISTAIIFFLKFATYNKIIFKEKKETKK